VVAALRPPSDHRAIRDPNVARYYDELWSFLRARISGELPAGPLTRLPDDGTTAN
jgi:hypothetical protein